MSKHIIIFTFLYLLSFSCFSQVNFDKRASYLVIRSMDAVGCEKKNEPNTCFPLKVGRIVGITKDQLRRRLWENTEWFEEKTDYAKGMHYWINTSHLVYRDELRAVTDSWPIRFLIYDTGDSRNVLKFKENGTFEAQTVYGNIVGRVFSGPDEDERAVEFRYPHPTYSELLDSGGLDMSKAYIEPNGAVQGELFVQGRFSDLRRPIFYEYHPPNKFNSIKKCIFDCDLQ